MARSVLNTETDDVHTTEFLMSTLADPEKFEAYRHWFDKEWLGWFEVADQLPRFNYLDHKDGPLGYGPEAE